MISAWTYVAVTPASASATYSWPFAAALDAFANFTFQHVGSSYTQLADQEPPFGLVDSDPATPAPGFFDFGDPTISSLTFDPKLPSYDIGNLRAGVRSDAWEAAAFVNNLWDERARCRSIANAAVGVVWAISPTRRALMEWCCA